MAEAEDAGQQVRMLLDSARLEPRQDPRLALLDVYQDAWAERSDVEVRFGKNESVNTLGELADRVLSAFLASDFALERRKIQQALVALTP